MEKNIIIIGGGSGGYVSAIRLSRLGNKVTLIEKDKVGGTCLNYGCIPTKSLYRNAEVYHSLKDLESFGIGTAGDFTLDIAKVQERKQGITDTLVGGIEQLLKANSVKVLKGEAKILTGNRVSVDGEELSFDSLIIATGSTSFVPPIKGWDNDGVITSTEMLEFREVPENLVIIGGGVIGMEFAGIMNAFGSKVTVVEALPSILPGIDSEMVKRMNPMLKKKGIEVFTSAMVSEIIEEDGVLKVLATTKKGEMSFIGNKVLIATGRKPNTTGFGLEEIGVEFDRKGIRVNENFETNVPGIYAVGDVNGKLLLAHAAAAQAEYVAEHISGHHARIGKNIPACVFMFPELAMVGMTEDTLKESGIPYTSSKFL
ncbi:MAG TPA: dihydrolipoyl dehydrogenase, partial [Clostridiaceae bacterium]|nr:dihydrolipoyl dehydrogenase [Clostridiaceae bacterium]